MSQIHETHSPHHQHQYFNSWKSILSPFEKTGDFISILMKRALSIAIVASLALFFFSVLSNNHSHWFFGCNECQNIIQTPKTLTATAITTTPSTPNNIDYLKTNISHILFGIGGSTKTWQDRRHYSELWWKPDSTRGFIWLDQKPGTDGSDPWPKTSPPYRVSEDVVPIFGEGNHRSAIRIARIVLESFRLGLENVRWFVLGDDDTVFFTENLVTVLSKYDHNQMYYIGGISESVEQVLWHSYGMAYGGGGFAVSYGLAVELVKLLDGCLRRYTSFYGSDERIKACVAEIGVPVTRELGFHQLDIRGDPYGFLAAHPVTPLVSLHHLDYVNPLYPNRTKLESLKLLIDAYETDPGRILQQGACYDLTRKWSISASWGYTVQLHPSLVPALDLWTPLQTFLTWRSWSNVPFTFDTKPVKPDPCESPIIYFLDEVVESGGGTVTSYRKMRDKVGKECEKPKFIPALAVQTIKIISGTKMNPSEWVKEAPRRQCCEMLGSSDLKAGELQVSMRRCRPGETVTFP